jgi:putative oxidoreductase
MTKENKNAAACPACPMTGGIKGIVCKVISIAQCKIILTEKYLAPLALLWARFYIARVFWKSGQTKIANLDTAARLFEWEYISKWQENSKSIFGMDLSWTVPDPVIGATLATFAELGFPVLLVLGLGARFGALGLLGMTATIELFIYPGTTEHYYWMTILLLLVAVGPGKISIDHFLRKKLIYS